VSLIIPALVNSDRPLLSLVVPTYNESGNVKRLVERISQILDSLLPQNYQLILVDDDSPDRTWEIAQSLQPQYPQLVVIRRQTERGLSTAVIRGWQQADGEILGVIDGDLQHPPEVLEQLLIAIKSGASIAIASRYVQGGGVGNWNGIRQFISQGGIRIAIWILPEVASHLSDPMSGYFLIQRQAIADCVLSPIGYKILLEVMARGRIAKVKEVGFTFEMRTQGNSKLTWRQYEELIRHLIRLRFATGSGKVGAFGRFLRFGLVGLSGVIVDNLVLFILAKIFNFDLLAVKAEMLKPEIFWSKAIAVEIAITNNFIWNDLWTFADNSQKFQGWNARIIRFLRFNLACGFGAVINIILFSYLVKMGLNLLEANLLAIAGSTAWNYLINIKFNWKV
jgi:dolichol-phosphate mannosyltransferase